MKKVLCVCYGNTCRSPMLEALVRRELGKDYIVESAGTSEKAAQGEPAADHSIMQMYWRGIDISAHRSRCALHLDLASYDHIIVVEQKLADELIHAGAPREHIQVVEIPNPWQKGLEAYRQCAAEVAAFAKKFAASLQ